MGKFNFVFSGSVIPIIPIIAGRNLNSGEGLLIGNFFGIVGNTVKEGESTELHLVGVYIMPKDKTPIEFGSNVYWNDRDGKVTANPEGGRWVCIGAAIQEADATAESVEVRLNGFALSDAPIKNHSDDDRGERNV